MEKLGDVSEVLAPAGSLWDEWLRLTRFLESARLAFAHERHSWSSPRVMNQGVRISSREGHDSVPLHKHLDAIDDAETLHGSILVLSYTLAHTAAADRLRTPPRSLGGIEDWGTQLLSANGCDWTRVEGGLPGAVEVAVARNAFAHGSRVIDAPARARLHAAGARMPPEGSAISLTHAELRELRGRLQSLLNASGVRR